MRAMERISRKIRIKGNELSSGSTLEEAMRKHSFWDGFNKCLENASSNEYELQIMNAQLSLYNIQFKTDYVAVATGDGRVEIKRK